MTFGVTPTGFVKKTFTDVQSGIFGYWRAKISKFLQLTEKTGLGNVGNGAADQIAQVWEALEPAYYSNDPDNADEASFEALCQITGTIRRGATNGYWSTVCAFEPSKDYAPGALVGNVSGQATNRWLNRDHVTTTGAGNYPVTFVSEKANAKAIGLTGTLVIAQPIDGWIDVTTTVNATPGQDVESVEALSLRREAELQPSGSATLPAIMARVSKVPGVLSVRGLQNVTDDFDHANGIPAHGFRLVVWDGTSPAALNNDIAAAILATGSAGVPSYGRSSGVANGETVLFDRATQIPIYVTCTVKGTAALADIQANVIAAGASLTSGNSIVAEKIRAAIVNTAGVTDLTAFAIGTSPGPVSAANIPIPITSIGLFDNARISVTFV